MADKKNIKSERNISAREKGDEGEKLAADFLGKIGRRILATKFRGLNGEIDIIAEDETGAIDFVEVKTRHNNMFGKPIESVDGRKMGKITRVAEFYLATHRPLKNKERRINFGVISIERMDRGSFKLIFYENVID